MCGVGFQSEPCAQLHSSALMWAQKHCSGLSFYAEFYPKYPRDDGREKTNPWASNSRHCRAEMFKQVLNTGRGRGIPAMRKRQAEERVGWVLEADGRAWGPWFAAPADPRERKWETKPETLELTGVLVRNWQVFSYLSVIWGLGTRTSLSPGKTPLWEHGVKAETRGTGKIILGWHNDKITSQTPFIPVQESCSPAVWDYYDHKSRWHFLTTCPAVLAISKSWPLNNAMISWERARLAVNSSPGTRQGVHPVLAVPHLSSGCAFPGSRKGCWGLFLKLWFHRLTTSSQL